MIHDCLIKMHIDLRLQEWGESSVEFAEFHNLINLDRKHRLNLLT